MFKPKFAMFFDNHTHRQLPDVGHEFNADNFAEKLKRAGVDLIGFHAKCNQGFCYYDTKIGIRHPSLRPGHDLFGEVVEACNKRDIRVTAYFNAGLSNETAIQHPDWAMLGLDGNFYHPEIEGTYITPYIRLMCLNSPWREQLKAMVREVLDKYPVAGFLFDGLNGFSCTCHTCIEGMRKAGMDPLNPRDVAKYGEMSALRLGEELAALIEPKKRGLLFNCLGLGGRPNARLGTYLECECIPTVPCWGYDWLPIYSRYFRTLTEGPVLNMTGRFYDWGDFGTLRTEAALEYDLFFGLAQGMRPNIGEHFHPRGTLFKGIFDAVTHVYDKIRKYDSWYEDAVNPVDMAVVFPEGDWKAPLTGAVRMLSELRMQFDVVDMENDWERYKVIVLPDTITFDESGEVKLKAYLAHGGKVVATGKSGLKAMGDKYCCQEAWGANFIGESPVNPPYFQMNDKYADGFPELPEGINGRGYEVKALNADAVAGEIIAPYFNKHWDGETAFYYTPPQKRCGLPFLILSQQVALCPWNLFEGYYTAATPDLRKVLALMLDSLECKPLVCCDATLPSFGRVIVADQKHARNVHLFNYIPELRGKMLIVEDELTTPNVNVTVETGERKVVRVLLAPDRRELPFAEQAGTVSFTVPELRGYALASVEFE